MLYLSSLAGSIVNFTANGILAVALHVPFLFSALMSLPYTPPVQTNVVATTTHVTVATTTNPSSFFGTPLTPTEQAAWEAKNALLEAVKCTGACIPFDRNNFFANEKPTKEGYVFSGSSTQPTISLEVLTAKEYQAPDPTYEVYIDNTPAGKSDGQFISQPSYSPNGKYFAFRSTDGLGGADFDTIIHVVNLVTKQVSLLPTYALGLGAGGSTKNNPFIETMTYADSYTWNGDDLLVTEYTVQLYPGDKGQYYRTSPINTWQFNLDNFTGPLPAGTLISSK